ncbi:S1C family serine protease [Zavarzinella formosa]|uniref:S1C family serine protease n=1 Tax=Zavarzinella formosa TaxID=360055 RepID=UPI00030DF17D|nr:trypsin-like peptidase domain-containing protein [Zavarzinella formosa]
MPSHEDYDFPKRPRRHSPTGPLLVLAPLVLIFLFAVLGVAYLLWRGGGERNPQNPDAQPREVTPRGERDSLEKNRIRVFKEISPSVVNVDTLRVQRTGYGNINERQEGTGSGFVWDTEGRIITNFHVVRDTLELDRDGSVSIKSTSTIRVTMADRSNWNARLVGVAPDSDLAVLQIDAPADKLKPIPVGTSADLEVGQTAFAIGNPFGQRLTFTEGIVSALDREIHSITDRPITGVIQTDASINPGNSGGPLLDRDGRLIGVNTAITSPTGGSVGIGYSIPVDTVNSVVPELIRTGRQARPTLGIVSLREKDTRSLGFDKGVMIAEVRPNSPAAKANLVGFRQGANGKQEYGDVITRVAGDDIATMADLERAMSKCKVHQTIKVTVRRGQQTIEADVTLEGI